MKKEELIQKAYEIAVERYAAVGCLLYTSTTTFFFFSSIVLYLLNVISFLFFFDVPRLCRIV